MKGPRRERPEGAGRGQLYRRAGSAHIHQADNKQWSQQCDQAINPQSLTPHRCKLFGDAEMVEVQKFSNPTATLNPDLNTLNTFNLSIYPGSNLTSFDQCACVSEQR